jgi:hypothetical protein
MSFRHPRPNGPGLREEAGVDPLFARLLVEHIANEERRETLSPDERLKEDGDQVEVKIKANTGMLVLLEIVGNTRGHNAGPVMTATGHLLARPPGLNDCRRYVTRSTLALSPSTDIFVSIPLESTPNTVIYPKRLSRMQKLLQPPDHTGSSHTNSFFKVLS